MFRNQYDQDVTTWSPQGRIHQVEYAQEAVKQGSAAIGLKSKTHVVLATLNRASSELSSHQRKTFKVDDHLGIAMSGIISDGRSLCRYMRNECLNHRYVFEAPLPTTRLVRQVADRAQVCTQRSWKRPYGVGLLVAGFDKAGAKLFYCCPSGAYFDYKAMAIGARSQAAKTYLERKFEEFEGADLDALIRHGLQALSASVTDGELTKDNVSIALVGAGTPLTLLEDAELEPHLAALRDEPRADGDGNGGAMEVGGGEGGPNGAGDGAAGGGAAGGAGGGAGDAGAGGAGAAPAPDEPPAAMETGQEAKAMPHVRLEQRDGGYAVVWLQREPVNTMDLTFWRELAAALQQAEADPALRGLIFASGLKRNVFTAGNDIKELYAPLTSLARYRDFWVESNQFLARLYRSPLVTIAAIRGACPAGGCCLSLCCDLRIMADGSGHIGLNEVAIGISVPLYWARLMARVVGQASAERLCQFATLVAPQEAKKVGLVDQLVPEAELLPAAEAAMRGALAHPDAGRTLVKARLRDDFAREWEAYPAVEAPGAWAQLEDPGTVKMLGGVLQRLSGGGKRAKL